MKLYEFFGHFNLDVTQNNKPEEKKMNQDEEALLADKIFWYMLDDDGLHKKYFLPAARQLKNTENRDCKIWIPMVNKACAYYYKENKLTGNPKEIFNKKFRKDLCKRVDDHFYEDILKDEYNLGN